MPFEDIYNEQVEKMKINIRNQTRWLPSFFCDFKVKKDIKKVELLVFF